MTPTEGRKYLSCAETAKLVREALKREFPGQKFSVRSSTYANGASIDVGWFDGPTGSAVDKVVGIFAGADFDGMIDLKTYSEHWLEPDGTVKIAHAQGTERSMGYLPEVITDPPSPNAQLVRFGADFVQTQRRFTPEFEDRILRLFEVQLDLEPGTLPRDGNERWNVKVPLHVGREGELHRMVDRPEYHEPVSEILWRFAAHQDARTMLDAPEPATLPAS